MPRTKPRRPEARLGANLMRLARCLAALPERQAAARLLLEELVPLVAENLADVLEGREQPQ